MVGGQGCNRAGSSGQEVWVRLTAETQISRKHILLSNSDILGEKGLSLATLAQTPWSCVQDWSRKAQHLARTAQELAELQPGVVYQMKGTVH